jgi:methyl-accepting chemotaxis protein
MKINTKIIILIAASLIFTAVVIGFLSVWQLRRTGEMSILQIEKIGTENIERIKAEGEIREKSLRNELLSQKKEYLKSQVQTTMSILEKAYKDQSIGVEEKQKKAAELISCLKYGPDNKDYFWINDMHPRMVMHPYKPELNGKDLSENKDPNGKRLFVEFVNVCREKDQGFVDYYWPKYGADKSQPKLSFVKLFKPWNWVVGTGIYIDDIETLVKNRKAELKNNIKTATLEMDNKIQATKTEIQRNVKRILWLIGLVTLVVLMVVLTASFIFTQHNITNPVKRIVEGLNEGAEQVVSASGQVALASQQLAEGSSEQAASIEETSSSLEEMSSMVKQNADNTKEAARLVDISRQSMKTSHKFLKQTKDCMEKISSDGEKTSKLLKNIDEIAFQTNLLALNAAVEAARAGESGAGFAVVADEVRNLAQRAASTAKDTEKLIGTTLENINEGVKLVASSTEEFYQMGEDAKKVSELFAEISVASQEQSQGIAQINIAVNEMDKVVQQNAANAEESASASEEMNAQAAQMKGFVDNLVALVGGNLKNDKGVLSFRGKTPKAVTGRPLAAPVKKDVFVHNATEVNPEQIIPMDEDVKDF